MVNKVAIKGWQSEMVLDDNPPNGVSISLQT